MKDQNQIEVTCPKLKCDAEGCGYEQPTKVQDLGAWVDALCPDCGSVLLTQEDYYMFQQIIEFTQFVSEIAQDMTEADLDEIAQVYPQDKQLIENVQLGRRASLKLGCKDGELSVSDIEWETH